MMKYILASASPRRKELLKQAGIDFEVYPSDTDEKITVEDPAAAVMDLAFQKADDVYKKLAPSLDGDFTVIGADTVVVYRGEILGKPEDELEAMDMLSMLSDRAHQVYTGVSLLSRRGGRYHTCSFCECTEVTFYPISREDLKSYIATGDPMDKAGAYGIQGKFAVHVKGIRGDYNNVVGLPIARLYQELKKTHP